MGVMELVAFLEEEFDIVLRDEDLVRENLDTLAGITSLVERRRPGAG
jgi:acyl carrier protein